MTHHDTTLVERLAGVVPGSPVDRAWRDRAEARRFAEDTYRRLLHPLDPGPVSLLERRAVAAFVGVSLSEPPAPAGRTAASAGNSWGIDMLRDVEMEVTCELGRTRMTVRQLLALAPGDVVELDRLAGSPADLLVNGTLLARGEVVVVDESFGLRITEIVTQDAT